MSESKFCYIDCTDTFNSGLNTGIQRVVKNIISRVENFGGYHGYTFIPVISVASELFAVDVDFKTRYRCTRFVNKSLGSLRNMLDGIFFINNNDIKDLYSIDNHSPCAKSNSCNNSKRLHAAIVSFSRKIIPLILKLPLFFDTIGSGRKKIQIQQDDVLFLADSFWNANTLSAARKAKASNARIILLIYDLIPITHPKFVDDINCAVFVDYLPEYLKMADGIIAISKYTMNEVSSHCKAVGFDNKLDLDYFYLGADFKSAPRSEQVDNQLFEKLSKEKYLLMVGTIEPRKNHVFVIEAFERLWKQGAKVSLCIVGKVGWKCDKILKRITESEFYNDKMFLYKNLNDDELYYCLNNSIAIIMASIVEGFGLPLIEAMHFNKPVIASDIQVLREIGRDYPFFFRLGDHNSFMEKVLLIDSGNMPARNQDHEWISWDESVQTLVKKVIRMAEALTL
jgi:O-antigen biosynthesis alpha-1,2-rhamnosyltransferase